MNNRADILKKVSLFLYLISLTLPAAYTAGGYAFDGAPSNNLCYEYKVWNSPGCFKNTSLPESDSQAYVCAQNKEQLNWLTQPTYTPVSYESLNCDESKVPTEAWYGFIFLMMGAMGVFAGTPAWFANITFLLNQRTQKRSRGIKISIISIALALSSLLVTKIPSDSGSSQIMYWSYGFYVWVAAFVCQLLYYVTKQEKEVDVPAPIVVNTNVPPQTVLSETSNESIVAPQKSFV